MKRRIFLSIFCSLIAIGVECVFGQGQNREDLLRERAFKAFDAILAGSQCPTLPPHIAKLPYDRDSKYVIFSDLHVGDNSKADNFWKNEVLFKAALENYIRFGYTVILLGDIEEMHQFDLRDILRRYNRATDENSVYLLFRKLFIEGRLYRVYGNHDFEWSMVEPISGKAFNAGYEAVFIGDDIMLTHGQQAVETYEEDVAVVRMGTGLYRWLENVVRFNDDSDSVLYMPELKDKIFSEWACQNKKLLICGHTHNPIISTRTMNHLLVFRTQWTKDQLKNPDINRAEKKRLKKDLNYLIRKRKTLNRYIAKGKVSPPAVIDCPLYVNTGGCMYYDGITCVEVESDYLSLVKWDISTLRRDLLYQGRIRISDQ